MGYPEVELQNNEEKFFNSAYILDRKGQLVLNYRKHFLYETDKTWC
jgi:protein N-terminal amidase